MNQDIKRLWIDALRSGNYQQGRGQLRSGDRYCCLGVLCELAVAANVVGNVEGNDCGFYYYDGDGSILPISVIEWAGLFSNNPEVTYDDDGKRTGLAQLNDMGRTFDQIADLIERNL
jgi:hypothetical protein